MAAFRCNDCGRESESPSTDDLVLKFGKEYWCAICSQWGLGHEDQPFLKDKSSGRVKKEPPPPKTDE